MNFLETCKSFTTEYINWFDIFVYFAVFLAVYFAIKSEYNDLFCYCSGKQCKIGNGAAYAGGKPHKNDEIDTLLTKIRISSRYDEESVYWRRTLIFSVLLTFTLLLLLLKKLPNSTEILIGFITIYLFTFLFQVYYQEVVSKPATKQVDEATKILSRKLYFDY